MFVLISFCSATRLRLFNAVESILKVTLSLFPLNVDVALCRPLSIKLGSFYIAFLEKNLEKKFWIFICIETIFTHCTQRCIFPYNSLINVIKFGITVQLYYCTVLKFHEKKHTQFILVVPFHIYDKNIISSNEQKCPVYVFILNDWDSPTTFIISIYQRASIFWFCSRRR